MSRPGLCNECDDVILIQPRQTVLTAAGSIGQASGDLLRHMGEGETDEKFQVGRHPLTVPMTPPAKPEDPHSQAPYKNVNIHLYNHFRLLSLCKITVRRKAFSSKLTMQHPESPLIQTCAICLIYFSALKLIYLPHTPQFRCPLVAPFSEKRAHKSSTFLAH